MTEVIDKFPTTKVVEKQQIIKLSEERIYIFDLGKYTIYKAEQTDHGEVLLVPLFALKSRFKDVYKNYQEAFEAVRSVYNTNFKAYIFDRESELIGWLNERSKREAGSFY